MIPGINFACNGSITGWSILARWRTGGSRDSYPYLLIWRSAGGDRYTLEDSTELFVSDNGRRNGIYLFPGIADPPVQFQAGDVLGIFQPPEDRSLVRLLFERHTGPTNYYVRTGNKKVSPPRLSTSLRITPNNVMEDRDLPAIVVQISTCNHLILFKHTFMLIVLNNIGKLRLVSRLSTYSITQNPSSKYSCYVLVSRASSLPHSNAEGGWPARLVLRNSASQSTLMYLLL